MRPGQPPQVGEMVRIIRKHKRGAELVACTSETLRSIALEDTDESTRMLAAVLAAMNSGQRKLLAFKARLP